MALFQLNSGGDPTDPQDYTPNASPICPTGTNQVCSITATDDGTGHPVINTAVLQAMVRALNSRTSNPPTVTLKA